MYLQERVCMPDKNKNNLKMKNIFLKKADSNDYLEIYKKLSKSFNSWIKPRSIEYIKNNIENYFVYKSDWKIIWCIEKIQYSKNFIEIWSLKVDEGFGLWSKIVWDFLEKFWDKNIFAVSWNKKVIIILEKKWFIEKKVEMPKILKERLKKSPGKKIFLKNV